MLPSYDQREYRLVVRRADGSGGATIHLVFGDFSKEEKPPPPTTVSPAIKLEPPLEGFPSGLEVPGLKAQYRFQQYQDNVSICVVFVDGALCGMAVNYGARNGEDTRAEAEQLALHYYSEMKRLFKVEGTGDERRVVPR